MVRLKPLVLAVLLAAPSRLPYEASASASSERGEGRVERDDEETASIGARVELYLRQHGTLGEPGPAARLERSRREYERRRGEKGEIATKDLAAERWVSLGPTNGAGRMTSLAPHPTVLGTLYAGAAGGGVWKTVDGGASWIPLTDDLPDLAVGAIALAPSEPERIYLGTGEPVGMPGIGLLTSTDGGATWALPSGVVANSFYRISVHPDRPLEVVAATDAGGLRSTDGGATWTGFLDGLVVTDLVRTADPAVLYAATGTTQVWKSEDGGASWALRSNGIPAGGVRLSLAISPSNPARLYAACEISGGSHIYRTTDGGQSWTDLDSIRNSPDPYLGNSGFWANTLAVLAGSPEVVVAGGVAAIRSTDGGATWTPLANTHADVHDLRVQGSTLWVANDGGVWSSPDGGRTAVARNDGLVTRQYYSVANDPSDPNRVLAGAQDNGTSERGDAAGSHWALLTGGDGFDCVAGALPTKVTYTSMQVGEIYRLVESSGREAEPEAITPPYDADERIPFRTLIVPDPSQPTTMYTGSTRIWRTSDAGETWSPLPTAIAGTSWSAETVGAIAVAPSQSLVLMAGKGSEIYRTTDGGQNWTSASEGLPGALVNRIAIDPADASIAYAAMATTDGVSVYGTSDGAHWEPLSSGLPAAPALVVRIDPTDAGTLYCGTGVGLFRSTDRGRTWSSAGAGLPATSVEDVQVLDDGSAIRIATFGRGVWELRMVRGGGQSGRAAPVLRCPPGTDGCSSAPSGPRAISPRS